MDDYQYDDQIMEDCQYDELQMILDENCKHENIYSDPNGSGYCQDCGILFEDPNNLNLNKDCKHENLQDSEIGAKYCTLCGVEVLSLDFTQEWRWYGACDNRTKKDPSRCHSFKSAPKGIKPVFDQFSIAIESALINIVETKFYHVLEKTNSKVLRGFGRLAIIAVCLFFTYQEFGEYRTATYIRNLFGPSLTQKNMSAGLRKYYIAYSDDRKKTITPQNLIPWIMKLANVGQESGPVGTEHQKKIMQLADYISGSSVIIKRGNPQSIAAAVVYFYLGLFPAYKQELGLTKVEYAKRVQLSDITISKIVTDIVKTTCADEWKG